MSGLSVRPLMILLGLQGADISGMTESELARTGTGLAKVELDCETGEYRDNRLLDLDEVDWIERSAVVVFFLLPKKLAKL